MATAVHGVWRNASQAAVRMTAEGKAIGQSGTQEIGTGTYTIMSQIVAEILGLPMNSVHFELGDSDLPPAPLSGGSTTACSVGPAVAKAAHKLLDMLIEAAVSSPQSPLYNVDKKDIVAQDGGLLLQDRQANSGSNATNFDSFADIVARAKTNFIEAKAEHKPGEEEKSYAMSTFGAQFVEVAVDPDLGLVKVLRVVGAYSGGRILNAKTARSQMLGGIIFGIGMTLTEQTVMDDNCQRIVNNSLGEYYLPANADIRDLEVYFVDEKDNQVNSLGVKGIGELGITGIAAAIANAVYNATGKRIRDLPITMDKLV